MKTVIKGWMHLIFIVLELGCSHFVLCYLIFAFLFHSRYFQTFMRAVLTCLV